MQSVRAVPVAARAPTFSPITKPTGPRTTAPVVSVIVNGGEGYNCNRDYIKNGIRDEIKGKIKNGIRFKDGFKGGIMDGIIDGIMDEIKGGIKIFKNGIKDGIKSGIKGGIKDGIMDGIKEHTDSRSSKGAPSNLSPSSLD